MRALCAMICLTIMLAVMPGASGEEYKKYQAYIYDSTDNQVGLIFDTVITLTGYAPDEETFNASLQLAREKLVYYHRLFDQYHEYPCMNNVCTLNRLAAQEPVPVERELFELLAWCKEKQQTYGSEYVNVALGSVLSLWHEAREYGTNYPDLAFLPDMDALREASAHTDMESLELDEENLTVYYTDPLLSLDLGAVAKGYAAELTRRALKEGKMPSFILNAGGNVCLGQKPLDGRSKWGVGLQNPDDLTGYVDILYLTDMNVVTSGDYQRYYTVDGKRYSHLISPQTLMPADDFRSVTVVADDAGFCDFLSTYLFIAPYETGRALIDSLPGVEAYWILKDGTVHMTDGMRAFARSAGADSK